MKANFSAIKKGLLLLLMIGMLLSCTACGSKQQIVIEGDFADGTVLEYTGQTVQFPVAHVEDGSGKVLSYDVQYKIVNLSDGSELTDAYATFELKTGSYQLVYTYEKDTSVSKTVSFEIRDTTGPVIEFLDVPNGLFLQDITDDTVNKLPLYSLEDASTAEGIQLTRVLTFKGEGDEDFREYAFREINNSYEITAFGTFRYELTATDVYGNQTVDAVEWKVKDRDWKPQELPGDGILADYSSEGYCNLVEGGDANQYYKIGNDYSDQWLEEFEGAQGVLKLDLSFNEAAGWGNNTIKLHLPKTFTKQDLAGKYLAIRIYVEGEHLKSDFLFAGNNVKFWAEDSTTRALTAMVSGLETGKWMTFYVDADTVEHIGMYPNATYNSATTFYEGGDPADAIQLCFHREAGYYNNMTLYVDSISIAQFLPDTELTVSGNVASWTAIAGAEGYLVNINGEETTVQATKITLPGNKGYIRVTPLGNGVTTLNAQTVTAVYGLDAGSSLARFDDALYIDLFSDLLKFSTEQEHNGYKPKSLTGSLTDSGIKMDIGTGSWGVVTGVRLQFPNPQSKGDNTTLILKMLISNNDYGNSIRVYDYDGNRIGTIEVSDATVGKFYEYELDISAYDGTLTGIQLIFGPNSSFSVVSGGVSVTFQDIYLKNTYYPITVKGQSMMCAGTRKLIPGYTASNLVQFTTFYNFGVSADDTPLGFSGTVLLDGKEQQQVVVVGYPNTDTVCFKLPHEGKILTIMKDSILYYGGYAVKVAETFNARWNGTDWTVLTNIPAEPETEYVTLADGSVKTVEDKVILQAAYTANGVVQFGDVYNFGVSADDTPLGFEGVVLLDGALLGSPVFVGYPNNTTIALKAPHQGQLLTILEGSVIYYGDSAVVVKKTFNQKWNGSSWSEVSDVPTVPETQYVTLADGSVKTVEGKVVLQAAYTANGVVQFGDVYNFGVSADDTPLGFEGVVMLDGALLSSPVFVGYPNNTTIALKAPHQGQLLTILEGSVIYYGDSAVVVKKTFNQKWNGSSWSEVSDVPTVPETQYVTLADGVKRELVANVTLTPGYTLSSLVQFTDIYDFGAPADSTPIGFEGTVLLQGSQIESPSFNSYVNSTTVGLEKLNHAGKVLTILEGSYIYNDTAAVRVKTTFNARWDGTAWTAVTEIPEPEEPEEGTLSLEYRYGTASLIQINTDLPATVPCANFLVSDNGCSIDESSNQYQQVGWIGMDNADGTIVLTFHFGGSFSAGQTYILPAGAVFGFADGSRYTLEMNYTFTFNGTDWTMEATESTEPEQPEEPEEPEQPEGNTLTFQYRYGAAKLIQLNTDLPVTVPCANFLTTDNGCSIDESSNQYQQIGWVGMEKVGSTIVLTLQFNNSFSAGQTYILPAGAVFGFTDGSRYTLDVNYTFTFNGTDWTMETAEPTEPEEPEEPETPDVTEPENVLTFQYRYGAAKLIQLNTDLPTTTPCANFLTTDNGCSIDESVNQYQQIGWVGMEKVGSTIVLTLQFNNSFSAGQTYILPAGAVFGFTDGSRYTLDKTYTFTFNGSSWTVETAEPTEPEEPENLLTFQYRYGAAKLIQLNTDLPSATPCANFLTTDNGCSIDESVNRYQQIGWVGMEKVSDTVVLTLQFNNSFSAGQTYILPAGAVFGFTDDKKYVLGVTYTFTFDGTSWTMTTD